MSFYTFMMRNYKGTDSPEGDLAADMARDKNSFQRSCTGKFNARYRLIREHLERNDACEACLDVFERCWKEYVTCEKSRLNRSLCRQ